LAEIIIVAILRLISLSASIYYTLVV